MSNAKADSTSQQNDDEEDEHESSASKDIETDASLLDVNTEVLDVSHSSVLLKPHPPPLKPPPTPKQATKPPKQKPEKKRTPPPMVDVSRMLDVPKPSKRPVDASILLTSSPQPSIRASAELAEQSVVVAPAPVAVGSASSPSGDPASGVKGQKREQSTSDQTGKSPKPKSTRTGNKRTRKKEQVSVEKAQTTGRRRKPKTLKSGKIAGKGKSKRAATSKKKTKKLGSSKSPGQLRKSAADQQKPEMRKSSTGSPANR